jgi:hypothetical protein
VRQSVLEQPSIRAASGVRDEEHSRAPVPRADSRSFKIENPDGVAEALQILTNVALGKFDDSRNVFSDHPNRLNFEDQARKLRPEIPVVVPAFPLASQAEGQLLAWKSSVYDSDPFG